MSIAKITVNGVPGSNVDLPLNTLVQFNNQGDGFELTFLWLILFQPAGAGDSISNAVLVNATLTPKKEGTYLIQLIVDMGLPSEKRDQAVLGLRHVKTHTRIPAIGESTEASLTEGWGHDEGQLLAFIDAMKADPGMQVCQLASNGLGAGLPVSYVGSATIKVGLPGQEDVLTVDTINATTLANITQPLGLLVAQVAGGAFVTGALVYVRRFGIQGGISLPGAVVGDPIFLSDVGSISLTPGTNRRRVGKVVKIAAGVAEIYFDGGLIDDPATSVIGTGDWSGPANANSVDKIKGATVPTTPGGGDTYKLLNVVGAAALSYAFLIDANVDAAAAINGTKINPNFGVQNLTVQDAQINGDAVVSGNLTVNGTLTTINSQTLDVADRVIHMNSHPVGGVPVPAAIVGINAERGDTGVSKRDMAGIFWREATSTWQFALNTGGDDATVGADLGIRVLGATLSGLGGSGVGVVGVDNSGVLSFTSFSGLAGLITLAGDVTGLANANVVEKLTGAGGLVQQYGALQIDKGAGLAYPTTGQLRVPLYTTLTEVITGRTGGTTNAPILRINGTGTSIYLGHDTAWGMVVIAATINIEASTLIEYDAASHNFAAYNGTVFAKLVPGGGTAVASTGTMRVAKDFTLYTRRSDNLADVGVLGLDGLNALQVGAKSDFSSPVSAWSLNAINAGGVVFSGTTHWYFTEFDFTLQAYYVGAGPTFKHRQQTSDTATFDFTWQGQSAFAGSTGTNRNGASLVLKPGLKDGAGLDGAVKIGQGSYATIGTATGASILLPYDSEIRFRDVAGTGNIGGIYMVGNVLYLGNYSTGAAYPSSVFTYSSGQIHWVSGGSDLYSNGNGLVFDQGFAMTIKQEIRSSDAATFDFTFKTQAPFAGATTAANKTPGRYVVEFPLLIAGGNDPSFVLKYDSIDYYTIHPHPAAPGTAIETPLGHLLQMSSGPHGSITVAQTYTTIMTPLGGDLRFLWNNAGQFGWVDATSWKISDAAASTTPLYQFNLSQTANFHFGERATSAKIKYDDKTSDVATIDLLIEAQGPYGSATGTNRFPGHTVVNIPAHVGTPAHFGGFDITYNGTRIARMGEGNDSTDTGFYIYGGPGAVTPTTSNWNFYGDGGSTGINGFSHVFIELAGTAMVQFTNSVAPPVMRIGSTNYSVPAYIFDMSATAVFHFGIDATSAKIKYDDKASDVATIDLFVEAQGPWASATGANRKPGSVVVNVPVSVSTPGHYGGFSTSYGGTRNFTVGEGNDSGATMSYIWLGGYAATGTPTTSNYSIAGSTGSAGTLINGATFIYMGIAAGNQILISASGMQFAAASNYATPAYILDFSATAIFHFGIAADSATIKYDTPTSDVATNVLWISGQNAYASATGSNRVGGDFQITQGSGVGGQFDGSLLLGRQNGNTQIFGGLLFDTNGVVSSNFQIGRKTTVVFVDTTSSDITITLPDPQEGSRVAFIKDDAGNASVHNITVARNGSEKIDGNSASDIISDDWGWTIYVSNGTDWRKFR